MGMSFCGLISEKATEVTCLLLFFLPRFASCKTCDQQGLGGEKGRLLFCWNITEYVELVKISRAWEGRKAGFSFAEICGTKQRFTAPPGLSPQIQEHQMSGGSPFRHGHARGLYSLCDHLRSSQCQSLPDKSSGVQGTEQCVVNARWQSLLSNQAVLLESTASNKIIQFLLLHINLLSPPDF